MPNSEDFNHIVSDWEALFRILKGKTIKDARLLNDEIEFTDGSILTINWQQEFVNTYELFEEPTDSTGQE